MDNHLASKLKLTAKSGGFTIVETLVAIAVLMIAIAGPLVVASKGLTSALYSKDQMTATFLAQESMEIIKNFRDNNPNAGQGDPDWLSVDALNIISGCYDSSNTCDATSAVDSTDSLPMITSCGATGCQLYTKVLENDWYSNDSSGNDISKFSRHLYVESIAGSDPEEARVHVIVDWKEGTIPYQVELVAELVDAVR